MSLFAGTSWKGHARLQHLRVQAGAHCLTRRSYRLGVLGSGLKPLLLMDVDGVLNPYPDCPSGFEEHWLFPEDDEPVRLASVHGPWLRELSERFALVWASAWGHEANRLLCPYFRLPPMPVVAFPPAPFDPAAKVPAIDAFLGDRAAAWVDDIFTPEAKRWANERPHPTLIVQVDPSAGLTRAQVDELLSWGAASEPGRQEPATQRPSTSPGPAFPKDA